MKAGGMRLSLIHKITGRSTIWKLLPPKGRSRSKIRKLAKPLKGGDRKAAARPERNWEVLKAKSVLAFRLLALILIGAAIYKPYIKTQVAAPARDYLFIVDVSKSMAAEDSGRDSRLETAKKAITEVSKNARGKLALILYAKEALVPSVFTDDYPAFNWIIKNWVNIESAPGGGTDVYPPLKLALGLIENTRRGLKRKNWKPLIVLFSDGGGFYQEDDKVQKAVKAFNKD